MTTTSESIFTEIGTLASQNKAFFRAIKEAVITLQNYELSANLRELEKELFYYRDENGNWHETDPTPQSPESHQERGIKLVHIGSGRIDRELLNRLAFMHDTPSCQSIIIVDDFSEKMQPILKPITIEKLCEDYAYTIPEALTPRNPKNIPKCHQNLKPSPKQPNKQKFQNRRIPRK